MILQEQMERNFYKTIFFSFLWSTSINIDILKNEVLQGLMI